MTHPIARRDSKPVQPKRADCLFDDGSRFGPIGLLAEVGPHAICSLGDGTVMPLPARAMAAPKRRRASSSSGERAPARG